MDGGAVPLWRERIGILALLLGLAAAAWAVLVAQAGMQADMGGLTMGMNAALFMALWVVMMVAMMFPAAAPMVLMFARVSDGRNARGDAFIPTWVFVMGYLAIWTAFGVAAYVAASAAERFAGSVPWLAANSGRIGGVAIVLAGLYQLSPLKNACLSKCRTPLSFVMHSWREGYSGALRMGIEHGGYCLGCCWLLFVILFPLGMTNVAAMAAITVLIAAEKSLPAGGRVVQIAAIALVAFGLAVVAAPQLLPTSMEAMPRGMEMNGGVEKPGGIVRPQSG